MQEGATVDDASYEILHNPNTTPRQWLKIVPPEITQEEARARLTARLRASVEAAKKASEIVGLADDAAGIQFHEKIIIRGKETAGFVSPHSGVSVEQLLQHETGDKNATKVSEKLGELLVTIYSTGFMEAVQLFLDHNIWMDDPNPGNLLLKRKNGTVVVLIDFANEKQTADATMPDLNFRRMSEAKYLVRRGLDLQLPPEYLARTIEQHIERLVRKNTEADMGGG